MSHPTPKSCSRCRQLKVRCDRVSPCCSRCISSKSSCSLAEPQTEEVWVSTSPQPQPPVWTPSDSTSKDFFLSIPSTPFSFLENLPDSYHECQTQPDVSGDAYVKVKRKRRRACLSCVRCHRLKVKCDKKEPCTRCRLSGFGKQCEYTHRVEPETETSSDAASPYVFADEDTNVALATWHSRHRGLSHWTNLLSTVLYL